MTHTASLSPVHRLVHRLAYRYGFLRGFTRQLGPWRTLRVFCAWWLKGQCEWVMGTRTARPNVAVLFAEAESEDALTHRLQTSECDRFEAERFALHFPPPTGAYLN